MLGSDKSRCAVDRDISQLASKVCEMPKCRFISESTTRKNSCDVSDLVQKGVIGGYFNAADGGPGNDEFLSLGNPNALVDFMEFSPMNEAARREEKSVKASQVKGNLIRGELRR